MAGERVGLVYLRSGYSPDDYPTDLEWAARTKLEKSAAAKCPSVAFQLAGAKKVSLRTSNRSGVPPRSGSYATRVMVGRSPLCII